MVGIALNIMQREAVSFYRLLDGIELFLISLWLVTATAWDLSKHDFKWEKPLRMVLIGLAIIDLIFLILIYVNNRVRSLDLDKEAYLTIAVAHFVAVVFGGGEYGGYNSFHVESGRGDPVGRPQAHNYNIGRFAGSPRH